MSVYTIGITPLWGILKHETAENTTLKYVAFANDLGGADELLKLRWWWDNIVICGLKLGYNSKSSKS